MKRIGSVVTVLTLLVVAANIVSTEQIYGDAPPCEESRCKEPACRCSTTTNPGGFKPSQTPQFVLLTFDDAVNNDNYQFYENLTASYKNPNNCNISMTFFVTHAWNDYGLVNDLRRMGHEIATHSVTHNSDVTNYWMNMTIDGYLAELNDMRTILNQYGNIDYQDMKGFRVPYLAVGGNTMYSALKEANYVYDCSWPTQQYTPWYQASSTTPPKGTLWPYTLDYASVQEQTAGTKPTDSIPGIWVNPMTDLQDDQGGPCSMLSECKSVTDELETSAEAVENFLKTNFKSHYEGERGPMGVYMHYFWFQQDDANNSTAHHEGFRRFLEYLGGFPDVYLVSVYEMIQWTQDPHTLDDLDNFQPLQCPAQPPPSNCPASDRVVCHYTSDLPNDLTDMWMPVCHGPCPPYYPWLGDPYGNGSSSARSHYTLLQD